MEPATRFDCLNDPLLDHKINEYAPLITRIDPKQIETMIESSKESLQSTGAAATPPTPALASLSAIHGLKASWPPPGTERGPGRCARSGRRKTDFRFQSQPPGIISIDDFAKLDLRIGTVLQCGFVEGSDKLLRFELDAGELGKRQIFSGIRASYQEPEKLVGRKVVFIANLAPRKMRFGVSEGMILSAGGDGGSAPNQLFLLDVDSGAEAGMPVK